MKKNQTDNSLNNQVKKISNNDLENLFTELRINDQSQSPSFAEIFNKTRARNNKSRFRSFQPLSRPFCKFGLPLALIITLVISLDLFFMDVLQKQGPENQLVQLVERFDNWNSPTSPLLRTTEFDQYWSASVTNLSSWKSPTNTIMEMNMQTDFYSNDNL